MNIAFPIHAGSAQAPPESPFGVTLDTSGLFTDELKLGDFPGLASARGLVALIAVPVKRLPPAPSGYDYVLGDGKALVVLDSFLNVNGRASGLPPGLGKEYPEIMPTLLVRSQRDGKYCQFTPEMHVDGKTGSMGILLDQWLGFGFNKQRAVVDAHGDGSRFDVTGPRGAYSVAPVAQGPKPSSAEKAFWDTMKSQVPALGSTNGKYPRSLFSRALRTTSTWDEYKEPASQSATAVEIRGDGLEHLGIEPGIYPGFKLRALSGPDDAVAAEEALTPSLSFEKGDVGVR